MERTGGEAVEAMGRNGGVPRGDPAAAPAPWILNGSTVVYRRFAPGAGGFFWGEAPPRSHARLAGIAFRGRDASVASEIPLFRGALLLAGFLAAAEPLTAQTTLYKSPGTLGFTGRSVRNAGDVNGDGYGDWVEIAASSFGMARVRSGANVAVLYSWSGFSYVQIESAASVGDVNGDGYDDVVLGIPVAILELPWQTGSAQVRSWIDGSLLYNIFPGGIADVFGKSVAGIGDIDGDGSPDFAVGAPKVNGFVRVYSERTGQTLFTFTAYNNGFPLAGVGDVNGDGIPDVASGNPYSFTENVRVYSGADGATLFSLTTGSG